MAERKHSYPVNYPNGRPHHAQSRKDQAQKTSKYRNKKTFFLGIPFASLKEENRYKELLLLEKAGEIRNIELQPRYNLIVNSHYIGFYKADFRYEVIASGTTIVEDVKSPATRTATYMLKKKLVKALYYIEIVEV